jgi:two-component system, OmpR family, osmolarity sensor histidine kinase EnvZ
VNLLPRTLFGRNLVLLVSLIVIGQIAGVVIMRQLVVKPRVEQLAGMFASSIVSIRSALAGLPAPAREHFIEHMNSTGGLHIERAGVEPVAGGSDQIAPAYRLFLRHLAERLPTDRTDIVWKTVPGNTLWVRVHVGDESYWVTAATGPINLAAPRTWVWVTLLSTLLAIVGAYAIQRRIYRPIRDLVTSAAQIADGNRAVLLSENAPREIAELARGFNGMSARLQAADAERTIMLAGVSHDLRSPLSKLRLALEIAGDRIEPDLRVSVERNIAVMDAVIGQFLDFARPDTEEAPVLTDLNVILTQVSKRETNESHFDLDLAPIPPLHLRRRAAARMIDNLTENARRYGMPPLRIQSGVEGTTAWFVVRDHGPGIPESEFDLVRKPFVRGDTARSGMAGAGLGLAIADRVVALHGGTMQLASPVGGGFEVRVELPLSER